MTSCNVFFCIGIITTSGRAYTIGSGNYGMLGDGNATMHINGTLTPVNVNNLRVSSISFGDNHSVVITEGNPKWFRNIECRLCANEANYVSFDKDSIPFCGEKCAKRFYLK